MMTKTGSLPLAGLRVISLAEQYPGPYATMLLADLGAEVILVERPGSGDPARQNSAFHGALNRNKRSVTVDLKTSQGKKDFAALVSSADILLEGYRPGTMKRLGFDYEQAAALNSRLIYVSITGFGQDGPYRDRPAHDLSYQAVAGLLFGRARSGNVEQLEEMALGDLSAGMFATVGVLAALVERTRTGHGRYIDVSMTDGLVSWMSVMLGPQMNGHSILQPGEMEPAYGLFRCADGQMLTLSIAYEDWFWRPLCEVLGLNELAAIGQLERNAQVSALRERVAEAIAREVLAVWSVRFDQAGIPWGPANDLPEVLSDPHFRARGLFCTVRDADGVERHHVAQPLVFSGVRPRPTSGVPALGEGNTEILGHP